MSRLCKPAVGGALVVLLLFQIAFGLTARGALAQEEPSITSTPLVTPEAGESPPETTILVPEGSLPESSGTASAAPESAQSQAASAQPAASATAEPLQATPASYRYYLENPTLSATPTVSEGPTPTVSATPTVSSTPTPTATARPNPLNLYFVKPLAGAAYVDDSQVAQLDIPSVQALGELTVVIRALDRASRVDSLELFVDRKLRARSSTVPFSWKWDTAKEPSGDHALMARARDRAGNSRTIEITVATLGQ